MQFFRKIIAHEKKAIENFFYMAFADIFALIAPFITYPYLSRTLGSELFGWTITAQALVVYASMLINYGFNSVCTKYVANNRDDKSKLSEIISATTYIRLLLCLIAFSIYCIIIISVSSYRQYLLLFILSFGISFDYLFFPQFYFQGREQMKYVSLIKLTIKTVSVILTFVMIQSADDFFVLPVINTISAIIAGIICYYLIFLHDGLSWQFVPWKKIQFYIKDSTPIYLTELVSSIKNQWNYLLINAFLGASQVVIYDIANKLQGIFSRPSDLLNIVLFPRMSREKNNRLFIKLAIFIALVNGIIFFIANLFLDTIVNFMIGYHIELLPVRIYLFSIIMMMLSKWIINCLFVARGHNRYVLYSMLITTLSYLTLLSLLWYTDNLKSLNAFVFLAIFSYLIELCYNARLAYKLMHH